MLELKRLSKFTSILFLLVGTYTKSYSQTMPTIGEIYDFDINDNFTFLFESTHSEDIYFDSAYTDIIILDKYFSVTSDTVFYVRDISYSKKYQSLSQTNWNFSQWTDTISISNLDSSLNYNFPEWFTYQFITNQFNGRLTLRFSDFSGSSQGYSQIDYYTTGCGNTIDSYGNYDVINDHSKDLIYFEKGAETWGQKIALPTSINQYQIENEDITISPNPTSEIITIKQNEIQFDKIEILDITGKSLKTYNDNRKTLNVSELQPGIYFISFYYEGNVSSLKFIKD